MSYIKKEWKTGDTIIADNLNNLENGVSDVDTRTQSISNENGGTTVTNTSDGTNEIWTQWDNRLSFGMETATAPVPLKVLSQEFLNGTMMVFNTGSKKYNRWGFHLYEGYSKDLYSRYTLLADKHTENGKKMCESFYYTGENHRHYSYGYHRIGSDVAGHSVLFDRDTVLSHSSILMDNIFSLPRLSSENVDNSFETLFAGETAYEPDAKPEENMNVVRYFAIQECPDGTMLYDNERNVPVMKINGVWCDLSFTPSPSTALSWAKPKSTVACTGITLDPTSMSFNSSSTQTIEATLQPSDCGESVVWTTSDGAIATVSNGVVTPISNGSCTITATCGAYSATCDVTINIAEVVGGTAVDTVTVSASVGDDGNTYGYIFSDGTYKYNTNTAGLLSRIFEVTPGKTYTVAKTSISGGKFRLATLSENSADAVVTTIVTNNDVASYSYSFTAPDGATYGILTYSITNSKSDTINVTVE